MIQSQQQDDSANDFNIQSPSTPFTDSISSIQWMPPTISNPNPPNIFAATTWDGHLRVYQVTPSGGSAAIIEKINIKVSSPITSCCWNADTNSSITVGCVDGFLRSVDLASGSIVETGKNNDSVSKVYYAQNQNVIISISYDKTINFWQKGNQFPVSNYIHSDKIYACDFVNPVLALATSQEKILIFDINNFSNKTQIDSPLGKGSQIQSLSINSAGDTIGFGSVDGRSEIAKLLKNNSSFGGSNYRTEHVLTFKANKVENGSITYMYPVNAVGFNKRNPFWYFTAGSDGVIYFWDYQIKKPIRQIHLRKNPVTATKVNYSGELMAYATGNDWHTGPEGNGKWPVKLAVHYIQQGELKYSSTK